MSARPAAAASEDPWYEALGRALSDFALQPQQATTAAWQVVQAAPPHVSLGLTHMLHVLTGLLNFELRGRNLPGLTEQELDAMAQLRAFNHPRSSPLLALLPHIQRRSTLQPEGRMDFEAPMRELVALAADRERFALPIQAWWPAFLLSESLAQSDRFEAALHTGMTALNLARKAGITAYAQLSVMQLSYTLLSMNDIDGALQVLEAEGADGYGTGVMLVGLLNNHLLALMLAGRLRDAQKLAERHPQLNDKALIYPVRGLCATYGWLQLELGHLDLASRTCGTQDGPWRHARRAVLANRCWIRARILNAHQRHAEAAQCCAQGLAEQERHGFSVSPMNRTQIHLAAFAALQALGDLPAAQREREAAHTSYVDWVRSATRAKLVAQAWTDQAPALLDVPQLESMRLLEAGADALPQAPAQTEATVDLASPLQAVAQVSHEMRNPIAGMLGMTSLLLNTALDEKQRNYVALARSSAEMLLSLCNDMLDSARLHNGRFKLNIGPCDLDRALDHACQTFMPHVQSMRLTLSTDLTGAAGPVWQCDETRVKQVLMNLLSNAVKFTRRGTITVRARVAPMPGRKGLLHVQVQDTGTGMSAQAIETLFKPYAQLDNQPVDLRGDMAVRGSGLGLSLCRRLLDSMGGRVGVESSVGVGSTFWFEVPLERAHAGC